MKQIKNIAAIMFMSLLVMQFSTITAFAAPVTPVATNNAENNAVATSDFADVEKTTDNEDLPDVTSSETATQSEPAETRAIPATEGFVDDDDIPDNTTVISDTKSEADTFDLTPPGGEATVIENEIQGNREFFTFKTPAGNVFYLVIERDKQSENVYFLNDVTESDLIALTADEKDKNVGGSSLFKQKTDDENSDETDTADKDDKSDNKADNQPAKSNISTYLIGGIALVAFIIIAYYFKVVKPKKSTEFEDEEVTDEDETQESDDESEFETNNVNYGEERD